MNDSPELNPVSFTSFQLTEVRGDVRLTDGKMTVKFHAFLKDGSHAV